MSKPIALFVLLLVWLCGPSVVAQTASKFTTTMPAATLSGRVTVQMTVNRTFGEHPVPNLQLYLVRVQDSKALQELQRRCRRALAATRVDPNAAYETCMASLAMAAQTVPQLASTANVQTDRQGNYRFENVPPGERYQIVGVRFDGGDPVVIVGLTPKLKSGDQHRLNLSENAAWTDALPPAR